MNFEVMGGEVSLVTDDARRSISMDTSEKTKRNGPLRESNPVRLKRGETLHQMLFHRYDGCVCVGA